MMQRIPLTTLAERLDKALGAPVGMKGLNILLYGWKKHRKYGTRYCAVDLTKMTADQAAFQAQKDEPGGKKTMKSYLWSLEGEAYDVALANG